MTGKGNRGQTRFYFPEIQRHIAARMDEAIQEAKARSGKIVQKGAIVDEINRSAQQSTGNVDKFMFSRMARSGNVADEHVGKFVSYFDESGLAPGFEAEILAKREYMLTRETWPDDKVEVVELSEDEPLYLYQIAFLWHGIQPPPAQTHWQFMTPEIQSTKTMLYKAVTLGQIEADIWNTAGGSAVTMTLKAVKVFASAQNLRPDALFRDEVTRGAAETDASRSAERAPEHVKSALATVEDWSSIDATNLWLVYEAAFLWHGFAPPSPELHFEMMPDVVSDTKRMLHRAIDDGRLAMLKESNYMGGASRHVSRVALTEFAEEINQHPRFLFPDAERS